MNMWGFGVDIFNYLERDFKEFLEKNINAPKSEFYLPFVVDRLINSGEKKVTVLSTEDRWYGVTYKQDKETVVNALREMTENGLYPEM